MYVRTTTHSSYRERSPRGGAVPHIDLDQGRVEYRAAGPEQPGTPPVVFLHGLLVDGRLWTGVAERLAGLGIRSYAPDLPLGAHRTPLGPDADLTPRGVARLVLDLLAALELTDVTLVGNDTGGALCQFVVDTDAERIGRLVLTNCDAFDKFPPPPFGMLVKVGRSTAMLKMLGESTRARFVRHSALGFGPLARNLEPDLTRSWTEPLRTDPAIRANTARFMTGIDKADLLDVSTRLSQFTRPVRLVWGDADRFFKLDFARRLAEVFPAAQITQVAGGLTFVPIDAPQAVADAVAELVGGART
jgi:pimeloyl-ACP methyl ester carboxylesterase